MTMTYMDIHGLYVDEDGGTIDGVNVSSLVDWLDHELTLISHPNSRLYRLMKS